MTKQDFAKKFSRWITGKVGLRSPSRITRRELASRLGVDPSMVTIWVNGAYSPSNLSPSNTTSLPRREHAIAIAGILGEPVDLVLLLCGHAPQADPHKAYNRLQDAYDKKAVKSTKKARTLLAQAQSLLEQAAQ